MVKRRRVRAEGGAQVCLFEGIDEAEGSDARERAGSSAPPRFEDPPPLGIWVAGRRLDAFLRDAGLVEVFGIRELVRSLDWSAFEARYAAGGRPAYHPAAMMGIVLLGLIEGRSSLRELEALARSDLRCWWLAGGLGPDHSAIGRFLVRHAEELSEGFFEALTREVLRRTGGSGADVAGDGTVVQAACSRYRLVKREAAAAAAAEARARSEASPGDEALAREAAVAAQVSLAAEARTAERMRKGRADPEARVCPSEPEAVMQPLKEGARAPAYKTSVLANPERVITAQAVDPTSETGVLGALVDQCERTGSRPVERLMLDAGYCSEGVLGLALEREIDLLCPEGRSIGAGPWLKRSERRLPKSDFAYDEARDRYECPAGRRLERVGTYAGTAGDGDKPGARAYVLYRSADCGGCALAERCVRGRSARSVKRYAGDAAKEALREVMAQPGARASYRRRQAWVEPVFAELKGAQKLRRFARRGLAAVRMEFALHASAHNLRRYLALTRGALRRGALNVSRRPHDKALRRRAHDGIRRVLARLAKIFPQCETAAWV